MSTTRSPTRSSEDIVDTTPFLGNTGAAAAPTDDFNSGRRFVRRQSLRQAARFLRQASGRRMMREPSMVVRETAAEQLEERQSDWAYSKPVVILDMIWNFAFVVVAATVMVLSRKEAPRMPLRLWIVGYAMQCVLHMVCVCVEYRRRRRIQRSQSVNGSGEERVGSSGNLSTPSREGSSQYVTLGQVDEDSTSVAKHLESANTMFSFIWWIIGFYWVSAGSQSLAEESPLLYWFVLPQPSLFSMFIYLLSNVPFTVSIFADQEGASKEDIEQLSKYKFRKVENNEKLAGNTQGPVGGIMTECRSDSPSEQVLAEEDAECCICLSSYDDGVELRQLPCGHHFHCSCIDKWLYINATCPLCKYNILKSSNLGQEEV
ncbi:hypothetical protein PIB30_009272 [Stylosanthes scabra]|uniref:RING-type E3 ubiquitin transferase n=1 Tax=Stylosanthes scabra TaxID=79078 RepID=A0ABU6R444_9FABA|nr:hypothetical protein [Stylosanthes scabra]